MKILIASILFLIFLFLAGIHVYWGIGGKWGVDSTIPTKENNKKVINPGPFECFVVALGLIGFGAFCLIKAGVIVFHLPRWLLNYGLWIIIAIFLLRAIGEFRYVGFFKKVNTTKFGKMDTKYYSPLCLFIAVSGIILELMS
ncbi:MAG: DUF3995 domain-containing protein [Ginsengibacter sp.]